MRFLVLLILFTNLSYGQDTLYTHPDHPPIVCSEGDRLYYKNTPRYFPANLMESFVILCSHGPYRVERFKALSQEDVVEHGMFTNASRIRKEFGLTGYSTFTQYFHEQGIFYPYAMETYILICFHQYLNQEKITWFENKMFVIDLDKQLNKAWKKRFKRLIKKNAIKDISKRKHKRKRKKYLKENKDNLPDERFQGEFSY